MTTEILILCFAGFLKAVKDRLDNPYSKHVFPTWGTFWVKGTGKRFLGFFFDAWHIADFLYISCFCTIIALHYQMIEYGTALNALLYFAITQTVFNIFYFILKRR